MKASKKNSLQVLLITPQPLLRQGMQKLLAHATDIEISAPAEFNEGLLSNLKNSPPDVAIVDVNGRNNSGLALAQKIKWHLRNIAVVVLTSNPNDTQLFQVLKAQAAAYITKEISVADLINVIHRTASGEYPINEYAATRPKVIEMVLRQFEELARRHDTKTLVSPLTPREKEILEYMAKGYYNRQIATTLGISEQTVKNRITSILRKLNSNARIEAVLKAIKLGLVSV